MEKNIINYIFYGIIGISSFLTFGIMSELENLLSIGLGFISFLLIMILYELREINRNKDKR